MMDHHATGGGAPTEHRSAPGAWITVALLALVAVLSWLDRLILSLLVVPIGRDLSLSDSEFGLLLGIGFVGVYVLAGLPIATALDRGNRKHILIVAIAVWCLGTVAASFANSFATLLLARSGVAIGEAALMPAAVSMIADLFPPDRRRAPTSVFMAVNILGATGAFVIGGAMVAEFDRLAPWQGLAGWRLTLISVGLLGAPVIALFALLAREPARRVEDGAAASSADTLAHLRAHGPLYLCTFVGVGLLAMVGQGSVAWLPTLLARGYELSPTQIGGLVAAALAPASVLGVAMLPLLTRRLLGRALVLRVLLLLMTACALVVPFALFVRGDDLTALLVTGAISSVGQGALVALTATLIQTVTPGPMRARLMALFFLVLNLLGAGMAPSAVIWSAGVFFDGPRALGGGLSLVAAFGAAGGLTFLLSAYVWSRRRMLL